jgi:hypothetical protein
MTARFLHPKAANCVTNSTAHQLGRRRYDPDQLLAVQFVDLPLQMVAIGEESLKV